MFRISLALALALMTAHLAFASGEGPLADAGGILKGDETSNTALSGATETTGTTTGEGGGGETTITDTSSNSSSSSSTSDDGTTSLLVDVDGAGFVFYEEIPESSDDCTVVFCPQDIDGIDVHREFYVPAEWNFSRWINVFTNTGETTRTITALVSAVLIYGENTISSTSSGDLVADISDAWIVAKENTHGAIGFVLQSEGACPVPVSFITFLDDEFNLSEWGYTFELEPGATAIIMNFSTATTDAESAAALSASLANLEGKALNRLSEEQIEQIKNFNIDTGGGGGGGLSCFGLSASTPSGGGGDMTLLALVMLFLMALYMRSFRRISPSA